MLRTPLLRPGGVPQVNQLEVELYFFDALMVKTPLLDSERNPLHTATLGAHFGVEK